MSRGRNLWLIWTLATISAGVVVITGMLFGGVSRGMLLTGKTTSGHYQIELACDACHRTPFGGKEVLQDACLGCHQEDLKLAKDSHPAKKFSDPRNADRLQKLAATQCVTCHTEHKPAITNAMGVTLPTDYCALCHQDIGKERPSHVGLSFATCADAGCHNYHDNRALYEDFLAKHAQEPDVAASALVKLRVHPPASPGTREPITDLALADAPSGKAGDAAVASDWLATAHAKAGVNCSGCHAPASKTKEAVAVNWVDKPDHRACATCHTQEVKTFTEGKHGMRLAADLLGERAGLKGLFKNRPLTPMRPELARLPMSPKATGRELTCTSCHGAHTFDTVKAEIDGCLSCHTDEHSKAYLGSPHHKLWQAERAGQAKKGTGVSCATCHLPRATYDDPGTDEERLLVAHNQNANLRPNEKMIRSVCMNCHGLGFTLNALADRKSIAANFAGPPSARVESIEWVMRRLKEKEGQATTGGSK